jgi:hypothetical protein
MKTVGGPKNRQEEDAGEKVLRTSFFTKRIEEGLQNSFFAKRIKNGKGQGDGNEEISVVPFLVSR